MRIAMVSTPCVSVPPRTYGGTELMVYELVEMLVRRGHEVVLFATADSHTSAELRHLFDTPRWPPGLLTDLSHVAWAMREVRDGGFDVVHAHSACALALGHLLPGVPLVYTLHHVRDEELSSFYSVFPEPFYAAISADQARREIPLRRVQVIHHGLDPESYRWREEAEDYLFFIGRFAEIKGPHTAVDVAAKAGLPIRVAGEVHEVDREFGEREVFPRLRQPHVTYEGSVGMDRKVPLLRDARALLAPVTWNEPFGLVLIEAMLSGCPVVAFPHGSVPELVEDGVTGFVARDAGEMAEIVRPGGVLEGFDRGRCRARAVERFGRERMAEEYEAYYRRAIREHRTGDALPALEAV